MFNVVSAHVDYFQDIYYQKPSWILFLLTKKFVGERDFPTQNSYTGQVYCLSLSRDKKFLMSLVQSANQFKSPGNNKCLNQKPLGGRRR